jgi:transposase InsO family protein
VLRREGHVVNRKKTQRLWREDGLRVPPKRRQRQRLGDSTTPLTASGPPGLITCGRWTTSSMSRHREGDQDPARRR